MYESDFFRKIGTNLKKTKKLHPLNCLSSNWLKEKFDGDVLYINEGIGIQPKIPGSGSEITLKIELQFRFNTVNGINHDIEWLKIDRIQVWINGTDHDIKLYILV